MNRPSYDDCNETELHWDDNSADDAADKPTMLEIITKNAAEIALDRQTAENDANSLMRNTILTLPVFTKWTMLDTLTNRIYATFDSEDAMRAFIDNEAFPALMKRIQLDRFLSLTDRDLLRCANSNLHDMSTIQFMKENKIMYALGWHIEDDAKYAVPTKWDIVDTSDNSKEELPF